MIATGSRRASGEKAKDNQASFQVDLQLGALVRRQRHLRARPCCHLLVGRIPISQVAGDHDRGHDCLRRHPRYHAPGEFRVETNLAYPMQH